MASTPNLPTGDYKNDGWTLAGSGVTALYQAWDDDDDTHYAACPATKGLAIVTFPANITSIPDGAAITSVTVFVRAAVFGGTNFTVDMSCLDNQTRSTSRTVFPTSTPTTYEVGTYKLDPSGQPWDIFRLNQLMVKVFSYGLVAGGIRCYKVYTQINYRLRPTITIEQPTGLVLTPSPVVAWTYRQADGDPQAKAEIKVFSAAAVAEPSFTPGGNTPVYSITVTGDVGSTTLPTALGPDSYKVYVRAFSSFGAVSSWASKGFDVVGPAPAIPGNDNAGISGTPGIGVPTVVPDSYSSNAVITMRDASNLLSVQQANFETSADFLEYTTTNCAIARDTTVFVSPGTASMKMTASSATTMSVTSTFIEIAGSTPITARAQLRSAVTARTINMTVTFYDTNFAALSPTLSSTIADSATSWNEIVATGTSHASAAYVKLKLDVVASASAEVHYVDRVGIMYGLNSAWSNGGHMSGNILSAFLSTGDDPTETNSWIAGNVASTASRVAVTGTGAHGVNMNRITYDGLSPSIALRAVGSTYSTTSAGTGFTLNKPAGVVDNDFMLAFITSSEAGTITPPSGWTLVDSAVVDDSSTDVAMWVLKRTGLTADPSTWTTGTLSVSSTRRTAVVVAWSGADVADNQLIGENIRLDSGANRIHTTASVTNTDSNAWRVAAFATRDVADLGTMTANVSPPTTPDIMFVGQAESWTSANPETSYVINRPANIVTGDLMVASVATFLGVTTSSITFTAPAGWTIVRQTANQDQYIWGGGVACAVLKRTAGASEPSSWTGTMTVSPGPSAYPTVSAVAAYRNALDASLQFQAENFSAASFGQTITTATVNNPGSNNMRICAFFASSGDPNMWVSTENYRRGGRFRVASDQPLRSVEVSMWDSGYPAEIGSNSRVGSTIFIPGYSGNTPNNDFWEAVSWIGIIKGVTGPPTPGANETERVDTRTGSADPWMNLAVYDSAAAVPIGPTTVTGTYSNFTPASMASWIGLIRPAVPIIAGEVAASVSTAIDISTIDPAVLEDNNNQVSYTASFLGSVGGTPYLILDFYRANVLLETQIAEGSSFGTSIWRKSSATFDIPEGTTHIRPRFKVPSRSVGDTVSYDRMSVALGETTVWRNGTGRREHPVCHVPNIQYCEDAGTGYGPWTKLIGQSVFANLYDPLSGLVTITDETVIPLVARKYRAQTTSHGMLGDRFVSGYGPASQEVSLEATNWWLKDIDNPERNMVLRVKAEDMAVDTTNTSSVFQPLGEDFPLVITEGYKGESVELTILVDRFEYAQLNTLVKSKKTLYLQSNMDNAWWVRPVDNLGATTLLTGQRGTNPLRWIKVKFVQVKPPEA
jgi:hypothetical protein